MIFRHPIQILCWILIVNSTARNVRAISFDDIFDYVLDALSDGDEPDELENMNIDVPCKNCNLSVVCHNCTTSHIDTQSTLPIQTSTQSNQQITSSSPLPTPTIPAPDRMDSLNNAPSEATAVTTQSTSTTIEAPPTSTATTKSTPEDVVTQAASKSIDDTDKATDNEKNDTTSSDSDTSDGVTDDNGSTQA